MVDIGLAFCFINDSRNIEQSKQSADGIQRIKVVEHFNCHILYKIYIPVEKYLYTP